MEIKIYLEIGKKYHENNEKLRIGRKEKKVVCKTARRAHSQKEPFLTKGPKYFRAGMKKSS